MRIPAPIHYSRSLNAPTQYALIRDIIIDISWVIAARFGGVIIAAAAAAAAVGRGVWKWYAVVQSRDTGTDRAAAHNFKIWMIYCFRERERH